MKGLSFVVCCHNSATRLPTTILYIANQIISDDIEWEILIVDNASNDETKKIAVQTWSRTKWPKSKLKIVSEKQLGIGYARYKGISEARFEYICFVDDDNWIDNDYASKAYEFMQGHIDVAACGSLNEAVADGPLPWWFNNFQRSYAVGPQSENPGDITWERGVLWSAGMVLRKSAVDDLLLAGFKPIVTGAKGEKALLRSEDYELCLALRLRGWKLWYEPKLGLKHYMPTQRLNWTYLRRLLRGVGASDPGLIAYFHASSDNSRTKKKSWQNLLYNNLIQLLRKPHKLIFSLIFNLEGDADVLQIERSIGLISTLLKLRGTYNKNAEQIASASWINITSH